MAYRGILQPEVHFYMPKFCKDCKYYSEPYTLGLDEVGDEFDYFDDPSLYDRGYCEILTEIRGPLWHCEYFWVA
jgi:hypothetical protein